MEALLFLLAAWLLVLPLLCLILLVMTRVRLRRLERRVAEVEAERAEPPAVDRARDPAPVQPVEAPRPVVAPAV